MIFPGEASATFSATEPTPCIRTVEPRDSLWKMDSHMALEIVGAGEGMRTAGVEARVSRGVVSEGLCGMFEPRDSLWKMGSHMAIEIVGAGGGMCTAGVEARVSRGVVSNSLCGGKEFVFKRGKA